MDHHLKRPRVLYSPKELWAQEARTKEINGFPYLRPKASGPNPDHTMFSSRSGDEVPDREAFGGQDRVHQHPSHPAEKPQGALDLLASSQRRMAGGCWGATPGSVTRRREGPRDRIPGHFPRDLIPGKAKT
jgi:hypothetical protein